ncbi:tRNA ligase 1 [Cocos nucifera]|uniref:tRNA ligase 1 n=1 Tax=Cocos nucifera TaxID=13894 RepID=A0A8K0IWB9_COCNU|nr:tRNA ligase 1 [Cocos nucifera]
MSYTRRGDSAARKQQWKQKPRSVQPVAGGGDGGGSPPPSEPAVSSVAEGIGRLSLAENAGRGHPATPMQFGGALLAKQGTAKGQQRGVWMPKTYVSASRAAAAPVEVAAAEPSRCSVAVEKENSEVGGLTKLFKGPLGADFNVVNNTFSQAQIRATFYPKFENEKSDQEVYQLICFQPSESLLVIACYFVTVNSQQSSVWDVTSSLHPQGLAVVTAVTELGNGKPKFYSTPELIAFCREWRLPTNHVWLFSTRKSVTSFFAAYDALCEEGTATPVCKALDEVADISVPGSKDHVKVQGEILEGLVARIVSHDSSKHMDKVLKEFPPPPFDGAGLDLGPSLREVCAANRSDEKQQIKVLLESAGTSMCPDYSDWFGNGDVGVYSRNADRSVLSKFLQAHPADYATVKLQVAGLDLGPSLREVCAANRSDEKQQIKVLLESAGTSMCPDYSDWFGNGDVGVYSRNADRSVLSKFLQAHPADYATVKLQVGFFLDINLFKVNKERATELAKDSNALLKNINDSCNSSTLASDGLANEDANVMIKLKFLTYKLRTFLIRNGLSILFKDGPWAYKTYYLRQMKNWGTSAGKQRELSKMLDEWAVYIRRKYGNKQLSSSTYLTEAEPFLEQYARRSLQNQVLVGSAGNLVRAESFLAIIEGDRDEEGDLHPEGDVAPLSPTPTVKDAVPKDEGLIVFFPGIPGCAKSALCKEILNTPDGLGDDRPVHSLMGDLIKGRYWQKVADGRRKKPYAITLADKNAPNEEVWRQIEDMCRSTKASAVPVVPESEGTDSNPFSLDALAVFIFRVLQRVNHPGNLDKASPNAGYVLLMFYHLYDGKACGHYTYPAMNRREFESELYERFGSLVKMPLLKPDRNPLPDPVKAILEEGINLFRLHTSKHGRLEPVKGSYAKEWARWEKRLREVLFGNADYLNSIQVPFDLAVKQVLGQLKDVAKGEYKTPDTEKRKFGNIVFAAVTLPVTEVTSMLDKLARKDPKVKAFLEDKNMENNLRKVHVTLAHKRSHGVTAVASYGVFLQQNVPVDFTALLFSDKLAALEARLGSVNGEMINSKNEWPHATLWTAPGIPPKEANTLPLLVSEGKATRIDIEPPVTVSGVLDFY